jgi:hypothetical protein
MKSCNRQQYPTTSVVLPGIQRVTGNITVTPDLVDTPTINNVSLPLASTEVSFTIPLGTKRFELKTRNTAILQLSYAVGQSGTSFLSIPSGCSYTEMGLDPVATITIYMQTLIANTTVEIVSWA